MAKIIEEAKVLGEIDAGNGRMVPHIRCRSETTIINAETNNSNLTIPKKNLYMLYN